MRNKRLIDEIPRADAIQVGHAPAGRCRILVPLYRRPVDITALESIPGETSPTDGFAAFSAQSLSGPETCEGKPHADIALSRQHRNRGIVIQSMIDRSDSFPPSFPHVFVHSFPPSFPSTFLVTPPPPGRPVRPCPVRPRFPKAHTTPVSQNIQRYFLSSYCTF